MYYFKLRFFQKMHVTTNQTPIKALFFSKKNTMYSTKLLNISFSQLIIEESNLKHLPNLNMMFSSQYSNTAAKRNVNLGTW